MKSEMIIKFWFEEIEPQAWFKKDEAFDKALISRFSKTHNAAVNGELFNWRESPEGRLAEIIVLDQFSRNMFRDTPKAFAFDPLALILAQEAIAGKHDEDIPKEKRSFLYMPFMHSESLLIHEVGLNLFTEMGNEATLDFEKKHKAIIERFGRYPHRNALLGRVSTAEELAFLNQPGSSF
jgi:uncharacterized protein (DUF924 family)